MFVGSVTVECKGCGYRYKLPDPPKGDMSFERFKKWLDERMAGGCRKCTHRVCDIELGVPEVN